MTNASNKLGDVTVSTDKNPLSRISVFFLVVEKNNNNKKYKMQKLTGKKFEI